MRKLILLFLVGLCALSLGACAGAPEPAPTPSPAPAPVTEYTVTSESAAEIAALRDIPTLTTVDASGSREYAALLQLYEARPDCTVLWTYDFEGVRYPNTTTELKAHGLEGLEDALRYLPALTYVDLIDTPATVEDLDRYSALRPEAEWYWSFTLDGFTIRTDIQCYSSLRDVDSHRFTDEELYPLLKYCKHLRALDLGHNDVRDLSLIGELKELEVLILADNPNLEDASPLAKLEKLIYLEFFMNHKVQDYSFLDSLHKIKDLNLCYCDHVTDLDFLENMPDVSFVLVKYSGVSWSSFDAWRERLPDAKLVYFDDDIHSTGSGWRDTERNERIRYAFTCWRHVTEYRRYDDVDFNFDGFNY